MTIRVGWTVFDDAPPGAHNLNTHQYCFAELGTASRITGRGTGTGNLSKALSLPGELPFGAAVTVRNPANGRQIVIYKEDRGYGQGATALTVTPPTRLTSGAGRVHTVEWTGPRPWASEVRALA